MRSLSNTRLRRNECKTNQLLVGRPRTMSLAEDGFDLGATSKVLASLSIRRQRIIRLQERKRDLYSRMKALHAVAIKDPEAKVDVELFSTAVLHRLPAREGAAILSRRAKELEDELEREEDEKAKEEEQTSGLPDWLTEAASATVSAISAFKAKEEAAERPAKRNESVVVATNHPR